MKLTLLALLAAAANPPEQPIPYSHKKHVALGLSCAACHAMPSPGELMTLPAESVCMSCHKTVKRESPAIEKLAAFAKDRKPLPWVRIYRIPSYVYFSHKAHLESGANCEQCHGNVSQSDRLAKEGDISMGACMDCHRAKRASNDCTFCHAQLGQ